MTITEISIKRPTLVVVIFTVLAVLGLFSYSQMNYELLPRITAPYVSIMTIYPGASPKVVETSITKIIEDSVSSMDKVKNIYATSSDSVSVVSIEFNQSADVNVALQDAQRKIGEIRTLLPDDAKPPVISKFAIDELPIIRLGVTSNLPSVDFYQFLKDNVQPAISKLDGVGQIGFVGGDEREIKVNVDMPKLRSYGLPLLLVTQAITVANLDFPTGTIKDRDAQFVVRIAGKFQSLDELRNLTIGKSKSGGDIKLRDVAEVQDTIKEYTNIGRLNGKSAVGILIQKQSDANAVEVSKRVRAELARLETEYRQTGLKFEVSSDSSTFTIDAANSVKKDLLIAILMVGIVMLIFLHSIRNSLIVMVAIPCSLISTFTAMYAFGMTLNLMTLLAMSLVIGILVDDSIVVLENIYRHLEKGEERRKAALIGRNEIGFTAMSITLVDVVVFLPLSLISGLVGSIVREYALVIVCSTLLSLFVSFTVTPLLASRFTKLEEAMKHTLMGRFGIWFEKQYHQLTEQYYRLLQWSLKNGGKVILLTTALIVVSLMLVPLGFVGAEFMSQIDRGEFTVTMEMAPGTTLKKNNEMTQKVEKMIASIPEVKKIFTNVGTSSEGLFGQSSSNASELSVTLIPKTERKRKTDEITRQIKKMINRIPGIKVRVNPIGIFGTGDESPIFIGVNGTDLDAVNTAARTVEDIVKRVPGTADPRITSSEGKPETRIEIDREKMASFGLNLGEVGMTLRTALSGEDNSKFQVGPNEYTIRVILDEFDRSQTADIENLFFVNPKGQEIELKQFSRISQTVGPTKLERKNRNYSVSVRAEAFGRAVGTIHEDIRREIEKEKLPPSVTIAYTGTQEQDTAFISLFLAMGAGILFVYLIMVALYNSYIYPFVVLFSIPVAVVGALLALAMTMKSLNLFSLMGMIMLIGLVSKNAIILVDFTNKLREEGKGMIDALLESGKTRLRPILMTTFAMVFGMLPIALSASSGAEYKSAFAWVLVGGLTSSLLLTLVLVPVMYVKVENFKSRMIRLTRRIKGIKD
ncbi:MAG: efflux RND transporter permease subunit [Candidatus Omnitrophota bacterium]